MNRNAKWIGVAALGLMTVGLVGCGTQQISATQYMTVNQTTKTVEFKVLSSTGLPQSTTTIDGAASDRLVFTIPGVTR